MSSRSTIQATPITNSRHWNLCAFATRLYTRSLNPVHMGNVVPQNVLDLCTAQTPEKMQWCVDSQVHNVSAWHEWAKLCNKALHEGQLY